MHCCAPRFQKDGNPPHEESLSFEQGEIRILVNVDQAGFANAAYDVHGTFAYAMALVVDDAAKAYERALALDAEPFTQPVADGELGAACHSGVSGAGSSISSTTRAHWGASPKSTFSRSRTIPTRRLQGFLRIDHVAQTVGYDEMLTWLLFLHVDFRDAEDPNGRYHRSGRGWCVAKSSRTTPGRCALP
ncbi:hypothetical protein ACOJBO_43305 [Rhizobium beringeri]